MVKKLLSNKLPQIALSLYHRAQRFTDSILNLVRRQDVFYVVEPANWVIKQIGITIAKNMTVLRSKIVLTPQGIYNKTIHFGSINTFLGDNSLRLPHSSNRIIVTWFHVVPGDPRIKLIPEAIKHVAVWHTACQSTKQELSNKGVPEDKIVVIPLGVNLDKFYRPSDSQKHTLRKKFGIKQGKIVIGSFQKDGNGWGKGLEPKLIKGPDIFCDAVEELALKFDIFVLLTGPARGYVTNRLKSKGIPFYHAFVKDAENVAQFYQALDLYLVTSRVEGGPQAVLESLATGVPLVTTRVGLAPDVVKDNYNGMLCDVGATADIVKKSIELLENPSKKEQMILNGLVTIQQYDWRQITLQYQQKLYGN
jgi:glycosyltransferase involved in cell wall biosynthesis